MKYETGKEKKERLSKMCKCGHTRGEHTYHKGSFCGTLCGCKSFTFAVDSVQKEKENGK